jgi:DNA polymerase-1
MRCPISTAATYDEGQRHAEELQRWIDRPARMGYVAVDTETTGLDEMTRRSGGYLALREAGQACYIPLAHKEGEAGRAVWLG